MFRNLKKCWKAYRANEDGQFAVWFAILSVPMLIGVGMVVDMNKATSNKSSVKNALDTAVLAAVSNSQLNDHQTREFAKQVFRENYSGAADLKLTVYPEDGRVRMTAEGAVETSLSRMAGKKEIGLNVASTAVMMRQNTICVLALASNLTNSVRFIQGADFQATNCSVQSNSTAQSAILSTSFTVPRANSFCAAGGATGNFYPNVRSQCAKIADPFANRMPPDTGPCLSSTYFNPVHIDNYGEAPPGNHNHQHDHGTDGAHTHVHLANQTHHHVNVPVVRLTELGVNATTFNRLIDDYDDRLLTVEESQNYTGRARVLQPGTYCGGLTVDGQNVVFSPGVYTMKNGPLTFKNKAIARGDGVSFVMDGPTSVLTVETGSHVYIKAPRAGEMAGLAFFQKRIPGSTSYPDGVNLIHSGGRLNVLGTLYFPTHAVDVFGDSEIGARSPATSFIAHQVTFSDEMEANIRVDAAQVGLPPILPASDDGARLVE